MLVRTVASLALLRLRAGYSSETASGVGNFPFARHICDVSIVSVGRKWSKTS